MRRILANRAPAFFFLLLSQSAFGAYIGNGLYEVEYQAGEALKGESARAYLYHQAFSACKKENKGFKVEELNKGSAPTLSFRCEGPVDGHLAAEVKARHLAAAEELPGATSVAPDAKAAAALPAEEEFAKAVADSETDPPPASSSESSPSAPSPLSSAPSLSSYANAMVGAYVGLSETGTSFLVAGRLGRDVYAQPGGTLALGLVGGYSGEKVSVGQTRVKAHTSLLMGEVISRKSFATGLYFGFRAGMVFRYAKFSSGLNFFEGYGTAFAWGPAVGYEFPHSSKIRANIDFFLLNIGQTNLDAAGTILRVNSSTGLVMQGGVLFDI